MAPHELIDAASSTTAPWWVKPLYVFGIPAGIAVFLIWFLATVVVTAQTKAQATLDAHMRDTEALQKTLTAICLILADGDRARESWCGVPR